MRTCLRWEADDPVWRVFVSRIPAEPQLMFDYLAVAKVGSDVKILGGLAIGFGALALLGQLGSPLLSIGIIAIGVYLLYTESRRQSGR
jgi:hypothetical protein